VLERFELPGRNIPELIRRRLHGRELFHRWLNGFSVEPGPRLVLHLDTVQDPPALDVADLRIQIELAAEAKADERWEVVLLARPRRRLAARVPAPALGWTGARAMEGAAPLADPVRVEENVLDNGLVHVEVAADGTLRLAGVDGVGRIVRGRDVGDSYNYAPPADDVLVDAPESVTVSQLVRGPLTATLVVERVYGWDGLSVPVETSVELRAGEPFVRVRVSFDNRHDDHRVRFHVPLPRQAESSFAEGQYAVVERGLEAEGGYGETPLPTFPASGFAAAGGVAALLEHVSEYEVLEGRELALTVLRSTGWISRNVNPYREDPAGPEVPIPDAQMRGRRSFAFALHPYEDDRPGPNVLEQAEGYRLPFLTGAGEADPGALDSAAGLRLEGEGVVLTALRRRDGGLEARIANETPDARRAMLGGLASDLRPWEIRTVQP
jgi:mannosylglycerate hydrolase